MDPDECLAQIRAIVNGILAGPASLWTSELSEQEVRLRLITLAGDVRDLDGWLSSGGFPPADWQGPRHLSGGSQ